MGPSLEPKSKTLAGLHLEANTDRTRNKRVAVAVARVRLDVCAAKRRREVRPNSVSFPQISATELQGVEINVDNRVRERRFAELDLGFLSGEEDLPLSVGFMAVIPDQSETRRILCVI